MAIKVGGTEVVDNNRQLKNIASVDATTVAALGTAGIGGGSSFDATMSGSVADGKPMILKTDGTVAAVGETNTLLDPPQDSMSFTVDSSGFGSGFSSCFHPPTGRTVVMYQDSDDNNKICLNLIDTGDGSSTPTNSGKIDLNNSWTGYQGDIAYDPFTESILIVWRALDNAVYLVAVTIPSSGNSVTIGGRQTVTSSTSTHPSIACAPTALTGGSFGTAVIAYRGLSSGAYGYASLYNTSGSRTLTHRTTTNFNNSSTNFTFIEYDPDQERFLIAFQDSGNSERGKCMVVRVTNPTSSSSNGLNFGADIEFETGIAKNTKLVYDTTANKMVVLWRKENASSGYDRYYAAVATINASNNSVSYGTSTQITTSNAASMNAPISAVFDSDREKILILFANAANNYGAAVLATVSGTSISFGSEDTNITSGTAMQNGFAYRLSYDTNDKSTIYVYNVSSSHGIGAKIKTQATATNLTSSNYIGIADAAYTNGQTATVQTLGAIDDAQSSLTIGSKYYVQGDGTIGTSAGSPSVEAGLAVSATKLLVKG